MINISLALILTIAGIFFFLLWSLNSMLFRPLLGHIDARKESLRENQSSISSDSDETVNLKIQSEEIIANAKKEANAIRENRLSEVRANHDAIISQEKEVVEKELGEFMSSLENERKELKDALLGQAPLFKEGIKAKLATA